MINSMLQLSINCVCVVYIYNSVEFMCLFVCYRITPSFLDEMQSNSHLKYFIYEICHCGEERPVSNLCTGEMPFLSFYRSGFYASIKYVSK